MEGFEEDGERHGQGGQEPLVGLVLPFIPGMLVFGCRCVVFTERELHFEDGLGFQCMCGVLSV